MGEAWCILRADHGLVIAYVGAALIRVELFLSGKRVKPMQCFEVHALFFGEAARECGAEIGARIDKTGLLSRLLSGLVEKRGSLRLRGSAREIVWLYAAHTTG